MMAIHEIPVYMKTTTTVSKRKKLLKTVVQIVDTYLSLTIMDKVTSKTRHKRTLSYKAASAARWKLHSCDGRMMCHHPTTTRAHTHTPTHTYSNHENNN